MNPPRAKSKKHEVHEMLLRHCLNKSSYEFDNALVKNLASAVGFGNHFDATKADDSGKLAQFLHEEDRFILHLGKGRHKFVQGISNGYHRFEEIDEANTFNWEYAPSILNEADTSESNILSVASNQRVMQHFLYGDKAATAKVYQSRRTKSDFSYTIGSEKIEARKLQIEFDQTYEQHGNIITVEAKNGFPDDFAVYQIYLPHLYYQQMKESQQLPIKNIRCCYLLRETRDNASVLRLYLYGFENPRDMTTIALEKNAEYRLLKK